MAKKKKNGSAQKSSKTWAIFSLLSAVIAAAVARKGLNTSWKVATGKEPPANPASPEVDLWEAVAWATASGTVVGIARMLAGRRAANYYAKSTGHLPAGVADDA